MSKSISVTDLMLIPELSHLRTLDFIDPANTDLIAPFLHMIGIDLDYPVQFIASQHRNLQGKVVVSYQIVGDIRCDATFLRSEWATAEDRMIAAGYHDLGLAQDLANSMTLGMRYGREDDEEGYEALPSDMLNSNEEVILKEIKVLNDMLLIIRGNPFKVDGSLATLAEHGIVEEPLKRRKKSKVAK